MIDNQTHKLYKPYLKPLARHLRKNSTLSEVFLWEKLKGRQLLGHKFRRQTPIDKYIVDFYCKELNLVIEIDGFSHDFKMNYDIQRQKKLESLGVNILKFQDADVKKDIQKVLERIGDWINGHASSSPTPTPPKRGM